MIEYSPNRDWLRDVRHLGTSWTLRKLVRASVFVGGYALGMCFVVLRLDLEGHRSISGTFSLLGVILSIILAFRTTTAYDRWWEGRKLWGSLVNHSRNLAIQLDAILPADDLHARASYAEILGAFAISLSGHLRRMPGDPAAERSPAVLAHEIVARIHQARRDDAIDGFDVLLLKPHTSALMDIAGACERIRKTPIPFSYSVFIKVFVMLYAAILPIGLVPEYGYMAVPLTMLIVFALLGLELMAEEIEDPFGTDCNDLPTHTIAVMIGTDAAALLGRQAPAPSPPAAPYSKVF